VSDGRRVAVVGGGITGVAAAHALAVAGGVEVVLFERDDRLGGKIRSGRFAGVDGIDEGPDAFLARVPHATALAGAVGLGDRLVSPTAASAAVWLEGLHPLPDGLVLGAPTSIAALARSHLLSWRGKARAAIEPLLPRTSLEPDAIGAFIRSRFGDEVHERIVDALVGSIYAADTDRFSLAMVPQLAALAGAGRSALLAARRSRTAAPAPDGAVFLAPRQGMQALVDATAASAVAAGAEVRMAVEVGPIGGRPGSWLVGDEAFDALVLATPARATAALVAAIAPELATALQAADTADVAIVTVAIPEASWPERLHGRSGYLVAKPAQRLVTAVSFGSQKWAHWRPPDGSHVLRISLGRDGLPVDELDDDALAERAIAEAGTHLDLDLQPSDVRVSRWPDAFPQYRPHHRDWLAHVRAATPDGIALAGAAYDGIGIPACVAQAQHAAQAVLDHAIAVRE
jgi:oxygen-dependent protoporphyrinogen oxidase